MKLNFCNLIEIVNKCLSVKFIYHIVIYRIGKANFSMGECHRSLNMRELFSPLDYESPQ
jgi:hypothetical protein